MWQPVVHLERRAASRSLCRGKPRWAGGITDYLMLPMPTTPNCVPVSSLHLISRCRWRGKKTAPLHKLGGDA